MRFLKISILLTLILGFTSSCQEEEVDMPFFTPEEQVWLDKNPIITLSIDNTYPPLNFENEDGNLVGLNVDLVRLIEERLGIDIHLEGSTWDVALQKALAHEIDGVINATALEERKVSLNFTEDFMEDPQTLVCNKEYDHNGKLEDFSNAKIAVKTNSIHYQKLASIFEEQNLVEVETLLDGIKLLSIRQVDAVYDDFAPVYHLLSTNNLNNISIVFVENQLRGSGIGLRNDDPVLLSVFDKAVVSISEGEVQSIKEKWLDFSPEFNYTPIYIGFAILTGIVIIAGFWNYSLSSQVASRTKQLEKELLAKEEVQQELTAHKIQLERIVKKRTEEIEQANLQLNTTNNELLSKHKKLEETIAELSQTQNQLIQSEKLASLGVFTAGIAHEINNPVNYITSASDVLFDIIDYLKEHPNALEEKMEDILYTKSAIRTGIDRTVSIISSLRNYAHSGGDDFVPYNVIDCINDALLLLQNSYRYHVEIIKDLPDSMEMYCIPGKLNQVFVNLINNAAQAIEGEGTIAIKGYWKKDKAIFEISDTGPGIKKENIKKIFDPFFTTKETGKGTGLGLYIVHGVITQHHGCISVSSEEGEGTTFRLEIPKSNQSNG